jgi:hypothetical protein
MIGQIVVFRDEFLRRLPANAAVLELDSGHGVLSLFAAEERPDIRVIGFDIRPPAVAVANRLLEASGHAGRGSFAVQGALRGGTPQPLNYRFSARSPRKSRRRVWCSSLRRSNQRSATTCSNSICLRVSSASAAASV